MKEENYYSLKTYDSKNFLKKWSHRKRITTAISKISPEPGDRILDFGAGDGQLLHLMKAKEKQACYVAYDPVMYKLIEDRDIGITVLSQIGNHNEKYNKVICMEVLEHLPNEELDKAIGEIGKLCEKNGYVFVSVPIEIGLPGVLKSIVRKDALKNKKDTLNILIGRTDKIARHSSDGYIHKHKGFNWKSLKSKLDDSFVLVEKSFSPVGILGGLVNSQINFLYKKK